jgi:perosamine synthetase
MSDMRIPLSNPDITERECRLVLEVLKTPNLSLGPKLPEFEEKLARFIGAPHAVAVNSGTSGLHLCVRALDIKDGDEVITTPFSFVASANCLLFERAVPVFVDIEDKGMNIDVEKLAEACRRLAARKKSRLKALLPVHVFGRPCEMAEIEKLAERYGLRLIEDSCEAIGSEIMLERPDRPQEKAWRKAGTFGDCSVFAFYPNKQMTTGEGGMIVTADAEIARLCRSMRNQGRGEGGEWLQHERLGYNYRLSDINCALGLAQLERLEDILKTRERKARLYNERLADLAELVLPAFEPDKKISWFVYVVRLQDRFTQDDRDFILAGLREKGIGCGNYFSPIHLQPFYRRMFGYREGDFPITEKTAERTIALPFYNHLQEEQIDDIYNALKEILGGLASKRKRYDG